MLSPGRVRIGDGYKGSTTYSATVQLNSSKVCKTLHETTLKRYTRKSKSVSFLNMTAMTHPNRSFDVPQVAFLGVQVVKMLRTYQHFIFDQTRLKFWDAPMLRNQSQAIGDQISELFKVSDNSVPPSERMKCRDRVLIWSNILSESKCQNGSHEHADVLENVVKNFSNTFRNCTNRLLLVGTPYEMSRGRAPEERILIMNLNRFYQV